MLQQQHQLQRLLLLLLLFLLILAMHARCPAATAILFMTATMQPADEACAMGEGLVQTPCHVGDKTRTRRVWWQWQLHRLLPAHPPPALTANATLCAFLMLTLVAISLLLLQGSSALCVCVAHSRIVDRVIDSIMSAELAAVREEFTQSNKVGNEFLIKLKKIW